MKKELYDLLCERYPKLFVNRNGNPGERQPGGWIRTLCKEHANESI